MDTLIRKIRKARREFDRLKTEPLSKLNSKRFKDLDSKLQRVFDVAEELAKDNSKKTKQHGRTNTSNFKDTRRG